MCFCVDAVESCSKSIVILKFNWPSAMDHRYVLWANESQSRWNSFIIIISVLRLKSFKQVVRKQARKKRIRLLVFSNKSSQYLLSISNVLYGYRAYSWIYLLMQPLRCLNRSGGKTVFLRGVQFDFWARKLSFHTPLRFCENSGVNKIILMNTATLCVL